MQQLLLCVATDASRKHQPELPRDVAVVSHRLANHRSGSRSAQNRNSVKVFFVGEKTSLQESPSPFDVAVLDAGM